MHNIDCLILPNYRSAGTTVYKYTLFNTIYVYVYVGIYKVALFLRNIRICIAFIFLKDVRVALIHNNHVVADKMAVPIIVATLVSFRPKVLEHVLYIQYIAHLTSFSKELAHAQSISA